jgi:NitT/TauT family transport system ATP-binding protein
MCGPSGCGKTTLLNAVAGLVDTKGIVELPGKLSYIFQEDRLLPWMTVFDNVAYVLKKDMDEETLKKRVLHYLEMVGLIDYKDDYPDKLSGGMKRRVSIARAFAYPSDVLLMDEPFKGLDRDLKEQIMKDFQKLWEEDKRTVIFVTHDLYEAEFLGTKMLQMKGLPLEIVNERDL